MDSRKVSCFIFFVVFSFVVCVGSFLIKLLFIRFNVVVVIGHDDIEMWTKSYTMRATLPSDWNLKRLSQRTSMEREKMSHSNQVEETAVTPK